MQVVYFLTFLLMAGRNVSGRQHDSGKDTTRSVVSHYRKTHGSVNISGQLYEIKMVALLFARALNGTKDFYLASNMESADKFDDIVFKLHDKTAFIQLKYRSKANAKISKQNLLQEEGAYSLEKYFQSYCEIKQQWLHDEDLKHCGTFENATFIIYTDCTMSKNVGNDDVNSYWHEILSSGGKCVSFTNESFLTKRCEESPGFKKFLSQLLFFSGQAALDKLDELIKGELKILYGTNELYNMFHDKVLEWWKKSECYLTHQEQFWKDILQTYVEKISEQKHKETEELRIKFKKSVYDVMRTLIMFNPAVHITSASPILSCIKVHHSLRHQHHLLIDDRTLQSRQNEVLALWSRRCDLLVVEEASTVNMEFVFKILQMYPQKRLVLVGGTVALDKLQHKYITFHDHIIVGQLDEATQARVLAIQVHFQGYDASLGEISGSNHDLVPASIITQLLRDRVVLGDSLTGDISYYIPRTLYDTVQDNEQVLPHGMTDLPVTSAVSGLCSHELSPQNYENIDSVTDITQRVVLVSAEPGMGKSALLTHLALGTKKAKPNMWVVKLNLSDFTQHLKELPSNLQLHHIIEFLLEVSGISELWKPLFRCKLETMENVCVLFDGYDEICPTHAEKVALMLKFLQATKLQYLWVTTRPVMKKKLQNKLSTLAFTFQPFLKSDQQNFLAKFWKRRIPDIEDRVLNNFVIRLLRLTANNLKDRNRDFMGIPLHSMMLAEAFEDNLKTYNEKGVLELPPKFDMFQLYNRFVEQKFKIINDKNKVDMSKPQMEIYCRLMEQEFRKGHMISAVFLLLPTDEMKNLPDLDLMIDRFKSFLATLEEGNDPTGIIKQIQFFESFTDIGHEGKELAGITEKILKIKPVFIHRTFAEYFAALWFAKNFEKLQSYLNIKMFEPNFQMVRKFFDQVLAHKFPLHLAVLNLDKVLVETLLSERKVDVNTKDEGGRTALHLAVMSDIGTRDDVRTHSTVQQIIIILLEYQANPNIEDKVLFFRPIHVAEKLREWSTVELLLEKQACTEDLVLTRQRIHNKENIQNVLISAAKNGCVKLVSFMLKCGVPVGHAIEVLYEGSYCIATMLHEAARHGQVRLVQELLSHGANTEATDSRYNRTALMWAAEQGHLQVVQALLRHGANIDAKDSSYNSYNRSTRAWAVERYRAEIVGGFIDPGCYDMYGNTALLLAAKNKRWDVAKVLLQCNADVTICDWSVNNVLHFAAESGPTELVAYLLDMREMDTECHNSDLRTPLWLAAHSGRLQITELLLNYNANLYVRDRNGHTPLRAAKGRFHLEVAQLLLEHGATDERSLCRLIFSDD
ncbi:hypothetical protein B7P43_G10993 [Cryptotermes secundus]|uniref:NACHT domain-containing protein n=2 Tax=Cryptotermes secundus TaxID=105785 RepID=A0A2J7RMK8_9NEOP|nr:hypothetical protein B7P43_G10993 [Cryptotermes secundus]